MMDEERLVAWVNAWKQAGPALERQRDSEVRGTDTRQSLESLAACFERAVRDVPARADSGLVEQQRWFQKIRP